MEAAADAEAVRVEAEEFVVVASVEFVVVTLPRLTKDSASCRKRSWCVVPFDVEFEA